MNIRDLLPIGSIVLLEGDTTPLMVYGVKQMDTEDEEHDYIGVMYPEGDLGEDYRFIFEHADIDRVIHKGFTNSDYDKYISEYEEEFGVNN